MSRRAAFWLAWSLAAVSMILFAASLALCILARAAPVPSSWGANLSLGGLLGKMLFLVFPLVGALIASRHPHNPVGWLFLADGLLWILTGMMDYYAVYGVASPGSVPFPVGVAGINHWLWVPAVGLLGTYLLLLFPDGRPPSRRWRSLAWLSGVVIVLLSIGIGLTPEPLENLGGYATRLGLSDRLWCGMQR